jgi:hypothetical protein
MPALKLLVLHHESCCAYLIDDANGQPGELRRWHPEMTFVAGEMCIDG